MILLQILFIFSLTFAWQELDGPFNILSKLRFYLTHNKYVGSFFIKLFLCAYCMGFWNGIIVYLLTTAPAMITFSGVMVWAFVGAISCIILSALLNKLYQISE